MDACAIDVAGLVALDLGASAGGFTDVLLRRGAGKVYAVDVGHGQLRESLRRDERVVSLEGLNARHVTAQHIPDRPDIIVCDVSFIGLKTALSASPALAQSGCRLIVLIKPRFEVGRERLGKGGVVRDPALHDDVCRDIATWIEALGWQAEGLEPSPIEVSGGNREFPMVTVLPREWTQYRRARPSGGGGCALGRQDGLRSRRAGPANASGSRSMAVAADCLRCSSRRPTGSNRYAGTFPPAAVGHSSTWDGKPVRLQA